MLESCKTAKERWGGRHDLIDRWLNERQDLLMSFCSINGLSELATKSERQEPVSSKVQDFCQILVDYVSAGHFEIYEQLIKEAQEFNDGGLNIYNNIYPRIEEITQIGLDFNDKYATDEAVEMSTTELPGDLSGIGELLEERFELEDKLINELHESHRELMA